MSSDVIFERVPSCWMKEVVECEGVVGRIGRRWASGVVRLLAVGLLVLAEMVETGVNSCSCRY